MKKKFKIAGIVIGVAIGIAGLFCLGILIYGGVTNQGFVESLMTIFKGAKDTTELVLR